MPERKTLNEDLFYRGSSANLRRLHTCKNKVPFWDFSQFAVTYVLFLILQKYSKLPLKSQLFWALDNIFRNQSIFNAKMSKFANFHFI